MTSVCGQCDGGCSIRVRKVGKRAINVVGNPLYPINRGGLCPRGLAGLQALYSPDRIRGPLKRVGARGAGRWEQITWTEAIETVSRTLRDIRGQGEPHSVVFLSGETRGLMDALVSRFCRAYGTPNDVRETSPALATQSIARYWTQGTAAPFAYDIENTNCLLSFGVPLLEGYASPVHMLRTYGFLRQERPGAKAKIFQIEPRLSVTGAKADEWVPINPGTEGALALGIAYVLIRESLYDAAFVEGHTFGFDDWRDASGRSHAGFRRVVLEEYSTDEVARITGVPVATILRIAKEFARRRPAIALGDLRATNAAYGSVAIHALNALVGSIDVPGGVVFPRPVPLKPLPDFELDETARRGLARDRLDGASTARWPLTSHAAAALPQALLAGQPYHAQMLLLYYVNPLHSSPRPSEVSRALREVPHIVSFSPFLDETTEYADLVLPDHTYLERWQDDLAPPVSPYSLFGLRQPVVEPVHATMHTGDALLKIAHQVGGPPAEAFPWKSFLEVLRHAVSGMYEARRGGIVERFTNKSWTALLEERGWWSPSYHSPDEFWAQLRDKGGWWDPVYYFGGWNEIFQTPSRKFEFYSLVLKQRLKEVGSDRMEVMLNDLGLSAREDHLYLPHYEPARFAGAPDAYPLTLNIVRVLALAEGRNADQPFLQEILAPHLHVRWDSWLEINPETAGQLGIADGDVVRVESVAGKVNVRARLYAGTPPNVVSMPANLGHAAYGRWAKGIGVNPMELVAVERDYLAGIHATAATRVRVSRA